MEFRVLVSDIHVHLHIKPDHEVLRRLDAIGRKLDLISTIERKLETTMSLDFTKMIAATTAQTNVTNSALQVLKDLGAKVTDLSAQLAVANSNNDPIAQASVQTQLDGLATGIQTNDDAIAAAIVAPGTPGTPPPA